VVALAGGATYLLVRKTGQTPAQKAGASVGQKMAQGSYSFGGVTFPAGAFADVGKGIQGVLGSGDKSGGGNDFGSSSSYASTEAEETAAGNEAASEIPTSDSADFA